VSVLAPKPVPSNLCTSRFVPFDSGKEVGAIKRENRQWTIYLFDKPSPISGSLQAAQYRALACYIETAWLNEGHYTPMRRIGKMIVVSPAQKR
jgi:hypothetical protein